ncbi:MAG: hypothetical protein JXI32_08710 [Deltaproteobacteria bacterium]|nr:hypothetical protein [Deltaproteobacteria bacterium]
MKKLFLGLLALSLVLAFAMPAAATDVSVSGSFYVAGYYDDNGDLLEEEAGAQGSSSAWYNTRLRVQTVFQVNPAIQLITRFDALEGYWNAPGGPAEYDPGRDDDNIDFDRAYMVFNSKYGKFEIGHKAGGAWGTVFCDAEDDVPRMQWSKMIGGWLFGAILEKAQENDQGTDLTDADNDKPMLYVVKPFKGGVAGLLFVYLDYAAWKPAGFDMNCYILEPYMKAKFGNVYVEAEVDYIWGKSREWDDGIPLDDVDRDGLSAYINAKVFLGNAYVGGQVAWVRGDDPNTNDEDESGLTGSDYNPCLILWNDDQVKWSGQNLGHGPTTGDAMANAWLYQVYAGFAPMKGLDLFASYTFAKVDEDENFEDDEYGQEIDITATYKVFDNLEYMVGFGYFMAGDAYKTNSNDEVENDYVVMHKLTLSF